MTLTGGKLGASRAVIEATTWEWPLHGLRHPPEADATGWYLWTGELQGRADFFRPWHMAHVLERCPALQSLLELPPGTRFIYAPDFTDTWRDESLLDV
ncbi:immunity protein Imm33 domain-containing protein [Terrabacter sp. 2YAF2]|uniref:immunity protein Imm33 domain-containing protein n=1 Tax=Terrabacter sp. 2YAF2 TaxID=3233026 RepID=UPI003F99A5B8